VSIHASLTCPMHNFVQIKFSSNLAVTTGPIRRIDWLMLFKEMLII